MFYPLEFFVGLRYTRAKRRNHFVSFISLISVLGVALGVATLITVISVMNGFEKELRNRILSMASHATISSFSQPLSDWPELMAEVQQHPEVVGAAPYVESEMMLSNGSRVTGALIRGISPEYEPKVTDIAQHMLVGELSDLQAGEFGIVLGRELAILLGVAVGDKLIVITPETNNTPIGFVPRLKRFTVVGLFEIGMYEYDRTLAFMHQQDAAKLLHLPENTVSGIRLKLADLMQARQVANELSAELAGRYWVSDWTRRHVNFFKAVQTERRVMFIILTLILTVAAFNIVSTLIMVVTDKQGDIAILRTLGMTPGGIMRIFMIQGTVIGLFGAALGMLGGVTLALNVETIVAFLENLLQTQFLAPDVYYISDLPSDLHWQDVVQIGGMAFLLSVLATLYPAWRAAKLQPVEALRYE